MLHKRPWGSSTPASWEYLPLEYQIHLNIDTAHFGTIGITYVLFKIKVISRIAYS